MQVIPEENGVRANPLSYFDVVDFLTAQLNDCLSLSACNWELEDAEDAHMLNQLKASTFSKDLEPTHSPQSVHSTPLKKLKSPRKILELNKQIQELHTTV